MKRIFLLSATILALIIGCTDDDEPEKEGNIAGNTITSIYIDENGIKWFGTENGISTFDGKEWTTYTTDDNLPSNHINDIDYKSGNNGPEIWIGTNAGAGVLDVEFDAVISTISYTTSNSEISGDSVRAVHVDNIENKWFGTNGGVSVFSGAKWTSTDHNGTLTDNPIQDIGTDPDGYAFITTKGHGVAVLQYVDAITTVTYYEFPWSPVPPSENVICVHIDHQGYQWYGTDQGILKHTSVEAKSGWELYSTDNSGLIHNEVISIASDNQGNYYFGTMAGVSKFDGSTWNNYTASDGLASNAVLSIAIDSDGSIWFGTDNGVSHLIGQTWTTYRKD